MLDLTFFHAYYFYVFHRKNTLPQGLAMRKSTVVIIVIFTMCALFGGICSNSYAANTCISCHGSADNLKALIKDEDFNKSSVEGYG